MATTYEIQTVSQAFSGRIPDRLWKTVGRAGTVRGAYRRYDEEYRWYHPQPNSWTGHVRVVEQPSGRPVQIDRLALERGIEYQVSYLD